MAVAARAREAAGSAVAAARQAGRAVGSTSAHRTAELEAACDLGLEARRLEQQCGEGMAAAWDAAAGEGSIEGGWGDSGWRWVEDMGERQQA